MLETLCRNYTPVFFFSHPVLKHGGQKNCSLSFFHPVVSTVSEKTVALFFPFVLILQKFCKPVVFLKLVQKPEVRSHSKRPAKPGF